MVTNTNISSLGDKYFKQVKIESLGYESELGDPHSSYAYIVLVVPSAMLKGYLKLKKQKKLPKPEEFWKETGLCERLEDKKFNELKKDGGLGYAKYCWRHDFSKLFEKLSGEESVLFGLFKKTNNSQKRKLRIEETCLVAGSLMGGG